MITAIDRQQPSHRVRLILLEICNRRILVYCRTNSLLVFISIRLLFQLLQIIGTRSNYLRILIDRHGLNGNLRCHLAKRPLLLRLHLLSMKTLKLLKQTSILRGIADIRTSRYGILFHYMHHLIYM